VCTNPSSTAVSKKQTDPHEVANPYNKTPEPNAWVILTLTNLGAFSKAVWKNRNRKLHDHTNTSSPTSDLDADIVNY
jgi:hypothetical protein